MPDGACGVESRGMREHGQPGFLPLQRLLVGIVRGNRATTRRLDAQDPQGGLSRRDPTCLRMVSPPPSGEARALSRGCLPLTWCRPQGSPGSDHGPIDTNSANMYIPREPQHEGAATVTSVRTGGRGRRSGCSRVGAAPTRGAMAGMLCGSRRSASRGLAVVTVLRSLRIAPRDPVGDRPVTASTSVIDSEASISAPRGDFGTDFHHQEVPRLQRDRRQRFHGTKR